MGAVEGNKAKTARRVIEVLEIFDEQHRHVTVMDIVRRYNRPQSSTSELLATLVEMGLLYKDPGSRSYSLTPRAAILGSLSQPDPVRDGTLSTMIDRIVAQTGLATALLGTVRLNAQIFRWCHAARHAPAERGLLGSGAQDPLFASAAGWLLLSTLAPASCERIVRRLNAEALPERKFSYGGMMERIRASGQEGYAVGPAGFGSSGEMASVLLPVHPGEAPMALGLIYEPGETIDSAKLVRVLQDTVRRSLHYCMIDENKVTALYDAA